MSRCYRTAYGAWGVRSQPKARTVAWEKARAKRAERRQKLPWQTRNPEGFIVKKNSDGGTILYNPGDIDRWLWCKDREEDARAEREASKKKTNAV